MKRKVLEYLVCPGCKEALELWAVDKSEAEEIIEGSLGCMACRAEFPIKEGVPRFLSRADYELSGATKKNFAYSWKKFATIYKDPRDFLDWISPKDESFFKDKVVLDAGCGTGKHAVFASRFGAKEVIAFDLSPAVDIAFAHSRHLRNVHVVQADIYELPLKSDFDYIYCIGVLQHLPDTEKGFQCLTEVLKQGGWLSIWVYGSEGTSWVQKVIDPVRKKVTSRMPPFLVFLLSFFPAFLFYVLAKAVYKPLSGSKKTEQFLKFLPMAPYFLYMTQFDFFYNYNSIFDQLIAPITQYFRREDVEGWFRRASLRNVCLSSRNDMSWRACGQKPG